MKKSILKYGLIALLGSFSICSIAQTRFVAKTITADATEKSKLDNYFETYALVSLPLEQMYQELYANRLSCLIDLSIAGQEISLHLSENYLYNGDYQRTIHTEKGAKNMQNPPPLSMEGYANNNPENSVRLTITSDYLAFSIQVEEITYHLESSGFLTRNLETASEKFVFYTEQDLKQPAVEEHECQVLKDKFIENITSEISGLEKSTSYCMGMAIVADGEYFELYGAYTDNVMTYLINEVESYFDAFVAIDIEIVATDVWTTPGFPFALPDNTHVNDAYYELVDYYNFFPTVPNRDVYHLFSGRILSNHGVALYQGLCLNPANAGAVGVGVRANSIASNPYFNVGDVLTSLEQSRIHGHELGHLCGAHFDHDLTVINNERSIMHPSNPYPSISNGVIVQHPTSKFFQASKNQIIGHLFSNGFCVNCPGASGGGCLISPDIPVDKMLFNKELSHFASKEIHYRAKDAQAAYIRHASRLNHILNADAEKYEEVQAAFKELKKVAVPLAMLGFLSKSETEVTAEHLALLDDFLAKLAAANDNEDLNAEIKTMREHLSIMEDKALKTAILDYDNARSQNQSLAEEVSPNTIFFLAGTLEAVSILNYEVPEAGSLEIALYNRQGQQLEILLSANIQAGKYQLPIEKRNLGAGLYFVHSQFVGSTVKEMNVQKMMVVE